MQEKTAIVTGATGVLGSSLCEKLLSLGYAVTGVARSATGKLSDQTLGNSDFTLVQADLSDLGATVDAIGKTDVVYHCAGLKPTGARDRWDDFYRGNVKATAGALRLTEKTSAALFVHCSTFSVFSEPPLEGVLRESTAPTPAGNYGTTKFIAEKLITGSALNMRRVIVRFPSIFGRQFETGIVPEFFRKAVSRSPIEVFSDGKPFRNLLHERDAMELLTHLPSCVDALGTNQIINYGSADSRRLIDIARRIRQLTDSYSEIQPRPEGGNVAWDSWIDTQLVRTLLNIQPRTIDESLALYVEEMRDAV